VSRASPCAKCAGFDRPGAVARPVRLRPGRRRARAHGTAPGRRGRERARKRKRSSRATRRSRRATATATRRCSWPRGAGRERTVALLLKHGVNPNAPAYSGYTPLHMAAWSGNARIVKRLLEKGADVKATDYSGLTPLHYASTRGVARALLNAGAEVNAAGMPWYRTPLEQAAPATGSPGGQDAARPRRRHPDVRHVAPYGPAARGLGRPPRGRADLVARGADVHYRDDARWRPSDWASTGGHAETVALLKARMAKTAAPEGRAPLVNGGSERNHR